MQALMIVYSTSTWLVQAAGGCATRGLSFFHSPHTSSDAMPVVAFTAGSLGDILATAGLCVAIARALYDSQDSSNEYKKVMSELGAFHAALISLRDVVDKHKPTLSSQTLVTNVFREVDRCHSTMHKFLDGVEGFRMPLHSTGIRGAWRKVWWAACEGAELASLRTDLSTHRGNLAILMNALNQFVIPHCPHVIY
jgi:hypothetical protein